MRSKANQREVHLLRDFDDREKRSNILISYNYGGAQCSQCRKTSVHSHKSDKTNCCCCCTTVSPVMWMNAWTIDRAEQIIKYPRECIYQKFFSAVDFAAVYVVFLLLVYNRIVTCWSLGVSTLVLWDRHWTYWVTSTIDVTLTLTAWL